jgi:hypothetical protein
LDGLKTEELKKNALVWFSFMILTNCQTILYNSGGSTIFLRKEVLKLHNMTEHSEKINSLLQRLQTNRSTNFSFFSPSKHSAIQQFSEYYFLDEEVKFSLAHIELLLRGKRKSCVLCNFKFLVFFEGMEKKWTGYCNS